MLVFITIPLQVFMIEGFKKMQGEDLMTLLIIKFGCHLTSVIGMLETEIYLIEYMRITPNHNMSMIILDIALLMLIDIP